MDMTRAKKYLEENGYTCVLCKGSALVSSDLRGVRPLLQFLDSGRSFHGFSACDKVVGRATAFLYRLLGVTRVHAKVMSVAAAKVLEAGGIGYSCDLLVPAISNRENTGPCPMEAATAGIQEPEAALAAIRATLQALQARNG